MRAFPGTFLWEMRGIKLIPSPPKNKRPASVRVRLQYDSDAPPSDTWSAASQPSRIYLHPAVRLVPVHVIQLYDDVASSNGWFSPQYADLLLDDKHSYAKHITSTPAHSPEEVVTTFELDRGALHGPQPDRVFDHCLVQFRFLEYTACKVDADVFINQNENCDTEFCAPQRVLNAINQPACAKLREGKRGVPLILTGRLDGPNAPTQTLGITIGAATAIVAQQGVNGSVIPHELGHTLDLDHVDSPDNLMGPGNAGQIVDNVQCGTAYAKAALWMNTVWPAP